MNLFLDNSQIGNYNALNKDILTLLDNNNPILSIINNRVKGQFMNFDLINLKPFLIQGSRVRSKCIYIHLTLTLFDPIKKESNERSIK